MTAIRSETSTRSGPGAAQTAPAQANTYERGDDVTEAIPSMAPNQAFSEPKVADLLLLSNTAALADLRADGTGPPSEWRPDCSHCPGCERGAWVYPEAGFWSWVAERSEAVAR